MFKKDGSKTIIVSNRLPLKIQKKDGNTVFKPSEGGLATGLGSIYRNGHNIWVGWPGTYVVSEEEKARVRKELKKENLHPVFLTKKEIKDYYEGFSNETLWPNFHYFPQHTVYKEEYYTAYLKVNQKFANEILRILKPNDTLWIHDYQLLLLPSMIREKMKDVSIGFFLHIPFPSYEVFRLLPWREDLLRGLLGADLIAFHTSDYMRHFLNSMNKFLGITNIAGQLEFEDRPVFVDTFPMGIDYKKYADLANSEKIRETEKKFRKELGNKKIILSIDRLDYSKGILERLNGFEQLLRDHPEYHEKVSLLQIIVPSRDKVPEYHHLKEEINKKVGSINSNYGSLSWTPIYYYYRSYPIQSLSAFYKMSDIALVTPLRDGMNLVCKEYIASRTNQDGVLVLSEMAGAASELHDAIILNPNNIFQVAESLAIALSMPPEEQKRRVETMQETIRKFDVQTWSKEFMRRLEYCKEKQKSMLTKIIDDKILDGIINTYKANKKRIIFLDYDGTLTAFRKNPSEAKPDTELKTILSDLAGDRSNKVVIISGRDKENLSEWFGDTGVDLIAEHGAWKKSNGNNWKPVALLRNDWKEQIMPIVESYVARTPGAFMEEKEFSIAWHYRQVDKGLGEIRTRELFYHLKDIIYHMDLQLLEGSMVLEIKNSEVNKGNAVLQYLSEYPGRLVIAMGDDNTDEDIFKVLPPNAISVKVRSNASLAKYHIPSHKEVRVFLQSLSLKQKAQ